MDGIDRATDAMDDHLAGLADGEIDHLGGNGVVARYDRDPLKDAPARPPPSIKLRHRVDNGESAWICGKQLAAEPVRILATGMGHLVDKALAKRSRSGCGSHRARIPRAQACCA